MHVRTELDWQCQVVVMTVRPDQALLAPHSLATCYKQLQGAGSIWTCHPLWYIVSPKEGRGAWKQGGQ